MKALIFTLLIVWCAAEAKASHLPDDTAEEETTCQLEGSDIDLELCAMGYMNERQVQQAIESGELDLLNLDQFEAVQ